MSTWPISTQCECQSRISNVEIAYSDSLGISKYQLECQNSLFRLNANVKIGFQCRDSQFRLCANVATGF